MIRAAKLEAMLTDGADSASLRLALGSKYLETGEIQRALEHLSVAVSLDPDYSAAWKLLGRAQTEAGLTDDAVETYRKGIEVATRRGDVQAAREMKVFFKRLG